MSRIAELVVDPRFGQRLHDLRAAASLSLRGLAGRTNYSRSYLWDLENGRRQPSLETARRLDRCLSADGALIALVSAPSGTENSSSDRSAEYVRTTPVSAEYVRTNHPVLDGAISWWRRLAASPAAPPRPEPPSRRYRLLDSVPPEDLFEVTRYAGAASGWRDDAAPPAGTGRHPVTAADVDTVTQVVDAYRRVDERRGGGHVHPAIVRFLDSEVAPLLGGRFDGPTGTALVAAAAEAARVAGWAAYDAGLDAVAQWHLGHAVRLARLAGDRALEAEVICAMAHHCCFRGAGAAGVDLARLAGRAAAAAGVDAIRAEAASLEAHGHAAVGDATACAMALDRAELTLERADRSRDPAWLRHVDRDYLRARAAACFLSLDRPDLAYRFASQLEHAAAPTPRGAAIGAAVAAAGYARAGEVEHACTLGFDALRSLDELRSARVVEFVARLGRTLEPHHDVPEVREFRARAGLE